jgi:rhamnosyltransferase
MKPDCSIIIRAYNEEKHIGQLLDGITQQTIKHTQTILVDSGSTDSTLDIASHYPVQVVHIQPDEFSFGRSLNRGIGAAEADIVVMASAHVYPVYPDWLERLIAPFSDDHLAVSYGKQRGSSASHFSEQQLFYHWYSDHSDLRQNHPFCNNANTAIRRPIWQEHPYNETLPALEDLAWARWAQDQGWGIAYVAEAEIVHVHNESWQGIRHRYQREGMAFKQIYPQETFGWMDLIRLWCSNVSSDFKAAKSQGLLGRNWRQIMRFRWMQFFGTYQGYRQSGPLTWQLKQAFYYPRSLSRAAAPAQRNVEPIQYDNHSDPLTSDHQGEKS